MNNTDILKKLYNDKKIGLTNLKEFKKRVKENYKEIKPKEIEAFYNNLELHQITKRKDNIKSNFLKIVDGENTYQIDIIIFKKNQKQQNRGYYMSLIMIDILSRFVFMEPLKSRNTYDIINSYENILKRMKNDYNKKPVKLISDDEFNNIEFIKLNKKLGIQLNYHVAEDEHFSGGNSLGIVDRFCMTIKSKILKYQLSSGKINFIDDLQDLVNNYNNSSHSSLHEKSPDDLYNNKKLQLDKKNEDLIYNFVIKENIKIDIGTYVRCIKKTTLFDKEGQTFSKKIYKVVEQKGNKYIIEDDEGNIKKKLYKFNELQSVNKNDIIKLDNKKIEKKMKQLKIKQNNEDILRLDGINKKNQIQIKGITRNQKNNTLLKKSIDKDNIINNKLRNK